MFVCAWTTGVCGGVGVCGLVVWAWFPRVHPTVVGTVHTHHLAFWDDENSPSDGRFTAGWAVADTCPVCRVVLW